MSCGFSIKNGCFFLQLPTAEQWYHASEAVLSLITGDFDNADDAGAEGHRRALGALKDYAGADLAFSEQRCAKALPQALIVYKEGLPAHYVEEYHERKARHWNIIILQFLKVLLYPVVSSYDPFFFGKYDFYQPVWFEMSAPCYLQA